MPDRQRVVREIRRKTRAEEDDRTGVLVGLTNIGDVVGYDKVDGKVIAVPGRLLYRGIDIEEITHGFQRENRHGFDETSLPAADRKTSIS